MQRRTQRPISEEFVRHIAVNGYTEELFNTHVRAPDRNFCVRCGKTWPCRMRQAAEQALALLQGRDQQPHQP